VLAELEVSGKPIVTALNKIDLLDSAPSPEAVAADLGLPADFVPISAATGAGIGNLLLQLDDTIGESIGLQSLSVVIPYDRSELVNLFHRAGKVEAESHDEAGTVLTGLLPQRLRPRFEPYIAGTRRVSSNGAAEDR
jgi:GTP-binding protein HflX